MIAPYLDHQSQDKWFVCQKNDRAAGFGFCSPEQFTEGTWNLYAIAVRKNKQGQGIGATLMKYLENTLRKEGQRILIVDTSGCAEFERTRKFYLKLGYVHESTIREFWGEGDDKVTFWKKL
ncbi:MAG: GNAT family N-acetyltransferase [Saprospiraceae bacterium]|nr:GNAT family N-acetyltransferase [Saprospiraceae bacterium]